jgi:hypothetical protein
MEAHMTKKQLYQRHWKKLHPHYNRDHRRNRLGQVPTRVVLLLGVRCDLQALQRARAAAEFIWLTR